MANVLFKRGLQASLPQGNNIVDGALYFTTDTKRLFLGQDNSGTKVLLPIAEGIQVVTAVSDLPDADEHTGEFYFISGSNILAWSNGSTWLQTNRNTTLAANQNAIHAVNASGVVTTTVRDTDGTQAAGTFSIVAGTNNVTIAGDATNNSISISVAPDTTYDLYSQGGATVNSVENGNDDVAIILDPSAGDNDSIAIKNSDSVKVRRDQTTGAISFSVDASGVSGISSIDIIEGSGTITGTTPSSTNGFTNAVLLSNNQKLYASTDPTIKYGENAAQEVHFVSGTATLDVPTRGEVADAITELRETINAMTYMGTASQASDITGATLHNGDVYLADTAFTISGQQVLPGYLIVVQGTETDGVIPAASATFDVVKGDSTDTQYQVVTVSHGIDIKSGSAVVGEIKLTAGNAIELTDTASANANAVSNTNNINSIEVKHANITRTDTHAPASGATYDDRGSETAVETARSPMTFMVVDEVTTNAQGHVTAVNYKKVTVTDSQLNIGSFTTTSTVTNGTATVKMESSGTDKLALQFKLASTGSIDISGSGDTTTIDVVWGSF